MLSTGKISFPFVIIIYKIMTCMPDRLPVPPYFVLRAITGATKNQPGIVTNSSPGIGEAKFSLGRLK